MESDRLKGFGLGPPTLLVGVLPQFNSINKGGGALQLVTYGVKTALYCKRPVCAGRHGGLQIFQTLFQGS